VFRADSASGAYRIVAHQTGVSMQGAVTVAGTIHTSESQSNNVTKLLINNTGGLPTAGNQQGGAVTFRSYLGDPNLRDAAEIRGVYLGISTDSNKNRGGLVFRTHAPAGLGDRMLIDEDGKVGIGTMAPSNQFVLKSGTGVDMEFGSEPTAAFIQTYNRTSSAYGHLRFITNGETMRLTNTGNVGIGTTAPSEKLEVNGNISFTGTASIQPNGTNTNLTIGTSSSGSSGLLKLLSTGDIQLFQYGSSWTTNVTFKAAGNVGIGTNEPNSPLTVWTASSASSQSALRLNNAGGFSAAGTGCEIIFSQDRNTSEDLKMAAISSMQVSTGSSAHGALKFWTRASSSITEKVRIQHNGIISASAGITLGDGLNYTAANTLDDYEEGTWTPTVAADATPGGYTYQVGYYTKIGRTVHVTAQFKISSISNFTGATININALPFTIANVTTYDPTGILVIKGAATAKSGLFARGVANTTYARIEQGNGTTNADMNCNANVFDTDTICYFDLTYFTA